MLREDREAWIDQVTAPLRNADGMNAAAWKTAKRIRAWGKRTSRGIPIAVRSAGATVNTAEDTTTPIAGISISDPDVSEGTGMVSVDLDVSDGTISLTGPASIVGNGSDSVDVSGSLTDVNATLANLEYTGK